MANGKITRDEVIDQGVFDALDQAKQSIANVAAALTNLGDVALKTINQLNTTKPSIDAINAASKTTNDTTQKTIEYQTDLTAAQKAQIDAQVQLTKAKSDYRTISQAENAATSDSAGKIEKLTAQIKLLYQQRKQLADDQNFGKNLADINGKINEQEAALKKLNTASQAQRDNIGNYKSALDGFSPTISNAINKVSGFATAFTSIGPAGILLGTVIAGVSFSLKTFFTETQAGLDMATYSTNEWSAQWDVIKGQLASIGGTIAGIGGSKGGFWADLKTGFLETLTNHTQDEKIEGAKAAGDNLAQMQINLNIAVKNSIKPLGDARNALILARESFQDTSLSIAQKTQILNDAIEKDKQAVTIEEDLAQRKIDILKAQIDDKKKNGLDTVALDTQLEVAEQSLRDIEAEHSRQRRKDEAELNTLTSDSEKHQTETKKTEEAARTKAAKDEEDRRLKDYQDYLSEYKRFTDIQWDYEAKQGKDIDEDKTAEAKQDFAQQKQDQKDQEDLSNDFINTILEPGIALRDEIKKDEDTAKNSADARKKAIKEAADVEREAMTVTDYVQKNGDQLFDARIKQIEYESDAKIKAAHGDAAKIAEIKKQEAIEVNKVQKKQFLFDQATSIAKVGINTAEGITRTLADVGLPAAIPLIVLASVMGAVELAEVMMKKPPAMPAYFRGTSDASGGLSMVGEMGRERIDLPGGLSYYTPSRASLVDLPAHSRVIPNDIVRADLADMAMRYDNAFVMAGDSNHSEQMQLLREIRDRAIVIPMGRKIKIIEGNRTTILGID